MLDFGRPIFAMYTGEMFPLSMPSIGDYCHMAYNICTALVVSALLERCSRPLPKTLQHVLVAIFVMGASIHLVGDSVQHRLILVGYKPHIPLVDNPIIANLQPPQLIEFFKLLEFYDEHLGHWVWYIPLFASYVLLFYGGISTEKGYIPTGGWLLLFPSAVFEWYLVTEGQIFLPFMVMLVSMCVIKLAMPGYMDSNALWLLLRSCTTLVLILIWVAYLWNDRQLRVKYSGILYIPEPWSYASLYIMK